MRSIALVLVLAATMCKAAEERRFERTNEHFAITLTSDWNQLEDAKKAPYGKHVLTSDADLTARAYQLASETNFAALIFVEVDEAYRIPEREVAMLRFDKLRQTFLTHRLEIEGLRLMDSTFYTNRNELRMSATADYPKVGKTRQLIGWFITDKGSYSVTCVAPAEHYKAVGEAFTKALDSFYVDPSLAYRPRPQAEQDVNASERKVVKVRYPIGVLCGGTLALAALIARRYSRVNSDEV